MHDIRLPRAGYGATQVGRDQTARDRRDNKVASGNVLRNRKRFVSEKLDLPGGEQILFGSVDGEAMVVDDWWELNERARRDRLSSRMNRTPMTLIPTNKRVVFYQARDMLFRDRMAEIPLSELVDVTFDVYTEADKNGKRIIFSLATFVAEERSGYPSVMFRTEISDLYTFNAERRVILTGICQEVGIHLSDMTDYQAIAKSGIPEALADASQEMYEDMRQNGEPPQPLEAEDSEESQPTPEPGFGRKPTPQGQPQMTGPILADYGQGSRDQSDPMQSEFEPAPPAEEPQDAAGDRHDDGDYRSSASKGKPKGKGRRKPSKTGDYRSSDATGSHRRPDTTGDYRRPEKKDGRHKSGKAGDHRRPDTTGDYRRPDTTGDYRKPDTTGDYRRPSGDK